MTFTPWAAAIGALLAVPVCALAQHSPQAPDPADPRVAVPAVAYASAFTHLSQPRPDHSGVTPDKTWKQANATVAATPAHAGHGAAPMAAGSGAHAGHAAPSAAPQPAPAAQPVAQPAARPAVDHSKHH